MEKGACLALKALARWIAATPLYNGSTLKGDNRNYASEYQRYDPARWDAAAAAAKAVIDFTTNTGEKRYSLYQGADKSNTTNFGNVDESNGKVYTRLWELFSGTARSLDAKKCEWIWFFLQAKTVGYHNDMYPPSSQGQAREVPVQEHVDEYEVIGPDGYGYPIYALKENHKALYGGLISEEDMAKAYDDANPYENRDPRFYRDITYHGAMFKGKWINTATGADALNAANSTTTGYFTHKFFDGYYTKGMDGDWNMDAPLIRLATIYLVYAEAVTRSKGATDEVYNMMNDLRARSFMAPIPPAAKTNKELLLDYILRERRVELYHEKEPFLLHALLSRTDQSDRVGQRVAMERITRQQRREGPAVLRQVRRLSQDPTPHLRHEARGRPRRQDLGRRQEIPHGTLLEGRPRVPRKALSLPDPDRRAATS